VNGELRALPVGKALAALSVTIDWSVKSGVAAPWSDSVEGVSCVGIEPMVLVASGLSPCVGVRLGVVQFDVKRR